MPPERPLAVLADLDGTLVDSRAAVEDAWRRFARERGLPEVEVLAATHSGPSREVVAALAPDLDAEAEARRVERWQVDVASWTRALPGAAALLAAAPAGRLAIVTSGGRRLARARLRGARLPVPEVLVAAEAVSAGKPDPEGYLRAAERLGLPPAACLAVEDTPAGVAAARAAGARVLALTTTHPAAALAAADALAPSLAEAPRIVMPDWAA